MPITFSVSILSERNVGRRVWLKKIQIYMVLAPSKGSSCIPLASNEQSYLDTSNPVNERQNKVSTMTHIANAGTRNWRDVRGHDTSKQSFQSARTADPIDLQYWLVFFKKKITIEGLRNLTRRGAERITITNELCYLASFIFQAIQNQDFFQF